MQHEIEAKFPLNCTVPEFRERLLALEAQQVFAERLMKRVLFGQEANSQIQCDYIRIRDEGDKITMSGKTHGEDKYNLMEQKEATLVIDSFEQGMHLAKLAGLKQTNYQESKRETWKLNGVSIELDTWPHLPTNVEIEALDETKDPTELMNLVEYTAKLLELDWGKRSSSSIEDFYMEHYDIATNEEVREKMGNLTFEEENPFE